MGAKDILSMSESYTRTFSNPDLPKQNIGKTFMCPYCNNTFKINSDEDYSISSRKGMWSTVKESEFTFVVGSSVCANCDKPFDLPINTGFSIFPTLELNWFPVAPQVKMVYDYGSRFGW